jgi:hypothetical protein
MKARVKIQNNMEQLKIKAVGAWWVHGSAVHVLYSAMFTPYISGVV